MKEDEVNCKSIDNMIISIKGTLTKTCRFSTDLHAFISCSTQHGVIWYSGVLGKHIYHGLLL